MWQAEGYIVQYQILAKFELPARPSKNSSGASEKWFDASFIT